MPDFNFCPFCGKHHPAQFLFCPVTGNSLSLSAVCPRCNQLVEPDWKKCGYCGQDLSSAPETGQPTPQINQQPFRMPVQTVHPVERHAPASGQEVKKTPSASPENQPENQVLVQEVIEPTRQVDQLPVPEEIVIPVELPEEAFVRVEGLSYKSINKVFLDSIQIFVNKGEFFVLAGPKGSGKTLLLEILASLQRVSSGQITIDGKILPKEQKAIRQLIGWAPHLDGLYENESVQQNLTFWGEMAGLTGKSLSERIKGIIELFGIEPLLKVKVERLSILDRRKISLAASVLHNPQLLLVDDPLVNLEGSDLESMIELLASLHAQGLTIIMSTRHLNPVGRVAQRLAMLSNGHVLAEGTPTELLALIDELGEIKIETATTAQAKKLAAVLNADPQVTRVEQHAEQVSALAKSAGKVLHKAVSEVHTLEILKAEVKKPELESVFFHLSGQIEQA